MDHAKTWLITDFIVQRIGLEITISAGNLRVGGLACHPTLTLGVRWRELKDGGERGIRTPGTVSGSVVFKTTAIDHSAISPRDLLDKSTH
jgi:hypothetical protein